MGISRQLYQLQEIDLEIDNKEKTLKNRTSQLGESHALITAREKLTAAQQKLDGLKRQQRSTEAETEDLSAKIKTIDDKLYGGKIRNPKELTDLQQESNNLKAKRSQIESTSLETMDQIDATQVSVANLATELRKVEAEWQVQQQDLATEIDRVKSELVLAKESRAFAVESIDPEVLKLYDRLKKQKGQALARIEQGICRGCRISLSSNEIQQSRCGKAVQCSSCGRILYLP